jgi:hypothetical protein
MEVIFLQNILGRKIWRGGDVKKTRKKSTNVKSFLNNHFKKEGSDGNN